jgi:hypothetical protein
LIERHVSERDPLNHTKAKRAWFVRFVISWIGLVQGMESTKSLGRRCGAFSTLNKKGMPTEDTPQDRIGLLREESRSKSEVHAPVKSMSLRLPGIGNLERRISCNRVAGDPEKPLLCNLYFSPMVFETRHCGTF